MGSPWLRIQSVHSLSSWVARSAPGAVAELPPPVVMVVELAPAVVVELPPPSLALVPRLATVGEPALAGLEPLHAASAMAAPARRAANPPDRW